MAVVCRLSTIIQKQQKQVHVDVVFYVQRNEMFGLKLVFSVRACMTLSSKSAELRHLKVHLRLRAQPNGK